MREKGVHTPLGVGDVVPKGLRLGQNLGAVAFPFLGLCCFDDQLTMATTPTTTSSVSEMTKGKSCRAEVAGTKGRDGARAPMEFSAGARICRVSPANQA